jgi:hypothetical protein
MLSKHFCVGYFFAQHVKERFIANNAEKYTAKPIAIALTVKCNDYKKMTFCHFSLLILI